MTALVEIQKSCVSHQDLGFECQQKYTLAAYTIRVCPWCSQEAVWWSCTAGMSTSRCYKIKICVHCCFWDLERCTVWGCNFPLDQEKVHIGSSEGSCDIILMGVGITPSPYRLQLCKSFSSHTQIWYDSSSTSTGSRKQNCRSEMCSVQCEKGEVSVEADYWHYWHDPALWNSFLFHDSMTACTNSSDKGLEGWGRKHCSSPPQWQVVAACCPAYTDSFSRLFRSKVEGSHGFTKEQVHHAACCMLDKARESGADEAWRLLRPWCCFLTCCLPFSTPFQSQAHWTS